VHDRIGALVDEQESALVAIAPELGELSRSARRLLAGGKRFRALFCYWGWAAVARLGDERDPLAATDPEGLDAVVSVASALELFHAAALVHDDIMDNSDLRRGRPSAHRGFEALHDERGWAGSPGDFGESTALLLGDLLLAWADELFERGTAGRPGAAAARAEFARMRTEVTAGQYLDILAEATWRGNDAQAELRAAHRVVVYKSAKYSIEAPLAIGAQLAGASLPQLAALRDYGLPLGVAFQLRDDLLGVFGDEARTGKPVGDDLREGKRTVLVALTRQRLPATSLRIFDELLGDRGLDDEQIAMLQRTIVESGAVEQVEGLIARDVAAARAALADAPLAPSARAELAGLAATVTERAA